MAGDEVRGSPVESPNVLVDLLREIFTSPLNLSLLGICGFIIYKLFFSRRQPQEPTESEPQRLPPLKKRDYTLSELKEYDGHPHHHDGRILLGVNGKVFDVTRGRDFYGPGGPYSKFAGRDASRGLGKFSVSEDVLKDEYDDLSDLSLDEMSQIREWEQQFLERYHFIGRLLKPGELPTDYTDTEEEHNESKNKTD